MELFQSSDVQTEERTDNQRGQKKVLAKRYQYAAPASEFFLLTRWRVVLVNR